MRRRVSFEGARKGPFLMALSMASVGIAAPSLLPIGAQPLLSLHTEALALTGWGLWLAWLSTRVGTGWTLAELESQPVLLSALAVLGLSLIAAVISVVWRGLPLAIGARSVGVLLAAVVSLLVGARLALVLGTSAGAHFGQVVLLAFCLAGLGNAIVCCLQFVGLEGPWASLGNDGRSVGNLGQPNLLGTQLIWAYAALVAWHGRSTKSLWLVWACAALLMIALGLSASRTAALSSGLLALWAWSDRQLGPAASRRLLYAAPVMLVVTWVALDWWHQIGGPGFAGGQLLTKADPTSSRWRLWQQCALMLAEHPLLGVGWGQFNFAWTLTPMPALPRTAGYTFTHAHDLPVHWAVELGLPMAMILVGLLTFVVWRAVRNVWRVQEAVSPLRRAALAMVLVVLLHSLLEFPLWHTHFLLPTAFLLGLAVAVPQEPAAISVKPKNAAVAPLLMALAGAFVMLDYRPIADVYAPPPEAPPLEQRIALARKSLLFGHYGDRFAGTMAKGGDKPMLAYRETVFEVLDWRLLGSWAQAHAENGEIDKARFLAQRLKEFDSPGAQLFFAACAQQPSLFQCAPSQQLYSVNDFRAELKALPGW